MMELYQLRTFVAVAEHGHLTRAAEKLHVSQPAVSAQIKSLEDELEMSLFERSSTGMALTLGGQRLLAHAERVLGAAQELRNEARAMQGQIVAKVSIGTLSDPEVLRLGALLSKTLERHPLLRLELHQEVSGAAFEAVRGGDLDASFYFGELEHPSIAGIALRPLIYRVAVPAEWRSRVADGGWAAIAAQPWILTPSISTHNRLVSALFTEHGVTPAEVVEADQESVIKSLVISGIGVSLLREDLALELERAGEVYVWPGAKLETTLWFIYPAERSHEPALAALLGLVREVWGLPAAAGAQEPPKLRKRRQGL